MYGSLTLKDTAGGGTITGGNENNFGGGVYVNAGTFTMQGGTITGNQGGGGGVYIDEGGTFNMTGGTITGNNAPGFGGGVCVSKGCTFDVSGSPVISGNWTEGKWDAGSARYVRDEENDNSAADDVQLSATNTNRTYITVTGTLESGASIYVNGNAEAGRAFAQAGADHTIGETDAACFHSDVGDSLAAMLEGNEVMFKKSLTEDMIVAIDDAQTYYSGTEQEPTVTVTDGETTLTEGTHYTVSYSNNVNAAESTAANAPTVTVTGKGSYTGTASKTFTINKKPVTVSGLTAKDKVYDGTTAATFDYSTATITGKEVDDDVTVVSATGTFSDKNYGTDIPVAISDITLGGTDVGNYVLAPTGNQENTTGNISKKTLTITGVTVANKEYDGNTDATPIPTGATITGVISGEEANVGFTVTGAFDSADKGNDKTVTLSGWTLAGTASSNYEVDEEHSQKTATASITGIQVYISGLTASDKTYDGTDAATVTGTAVLKKARNNDVVTGLTVSDITAKFADKNVGTGKAVTITDGTLSDSTNYTLVTSVTTGLTANITAKPVTITGLSAENKVYDGNTTATVTGTAVISGLVSGDTVTVTAGSAAFADENAGDGKTVTFSGYALDGADKGNYTLSAQPASVTANITKANATCTAPVAKTGLIYGGSAQALVTAGSAVGGEMQYSLDGNTYGTGIPEGTDAKSYTVYYKVVGDKNHNDVAPKSIAVSIAKEDQLAPSLTSPVTITAPATTAEITGVTTAMEYSTDNKTWTACDAPFSVGKGVYYIRLKADANHNAGSAATVIAKGTDEYALTVTGGTGSGGYEAGASVSVSATVPAGEKFVNWGSVSGVMLTDEQKAAASITVTMPDSDVTLTANFEDLTVTGITLNKTSLSLAPNATATLTVSYQPSGVKDTYKGVTWTSSNESVATVDGSGKVTTKAEGTATITAKSTSNTSAEATCTVTVKKQSPTPTPTPSYDPTPSGRDDTPSTPSTPSTPAEDTHISETATGADGAAVTKEVDASTTTKKNSDGSTTVTDTVKETQTTESKDGTKVETATESTKAETTNSVKNSDGSVTDTTKVQNTETVKETATDANGSQTVTETKTEQEQNTAVTTKDNADGSKSEKTETTETVKVTEKVTDGSGKVTETVTTTKTETVTDMTAAQDGTATGTSTTTTTVTDDKGKVLSTTVTEAEIKASTDAEGVVTTETTATVTKTDANGSVTTEQTVTTEAKAPDGSTGTIVKDGEGNVLSQETTISQQEAEKARDEGRPAQSPLKVTPVPETVEDKAAPVQVNLPSLLYDKDGDSIVTVSEMPKVEIQVTYDGPGVVAKEYGADGTLRTVKECREGSVIVPVTGSGELVIVDNSKQFNDVNATDWYGEYVTFVTAREIFNGTGDGNFSPDATMTRAMLAQVLYNFARDSKAGNGAAFENVNAGDWFNAAVGWAYENGIVNGYGSSFGAQDNISRQDLATILYRFAKAAGYDVSKSASLDKFSDAGSVADYAAEAMRWAVGMGLIEGSDGKLNPTGNATRAQVAAIMTRFVRNAK